jgi:ABC-type transporter Mla subunit MlaD
MAKRRTVELRLVVGTNQLKYRGSEAFLQSVVPRLLDQIDSLRISNLGAAAATLHELVADSRNAMEELDATTATLEDQVGEMDEATQLMQRLQKYLDAYTKSFAVLSNILRRISVTADSIAQNLK